MPDAPTALVVVDVQNDFCPGGALAVPGGDRVVAPINRLMAAARDAACPVFASRDWHPATSTHFVERGGSWPRHCVAGTSGAAFHADLTLGADTIVVTKGQRIDEDGYSVFDGTTAGNTPFADAMAALGVTRLIVCGLATDYCVQASVLEARARRIPVSVVRDAIAAVNLHPDDEKAALEAMRATAADIIDTTAALTRLAAAGPRLR